MDGHATARVNVRVGSKTEVVLLERHVRSNPKSRPRQVSPACPFRARSGSREISSASPRASDEAIELRAFPDGAENWSHDILGVLQHYLPPAVISRARFVERVT